MFSGMHLGPVFYIGMGLLIAALLVSKFTGGRDF